MRLPRRALFLSLCLPCVALAGERPSLAVHDITGPVRIDGVLDEPAWSQAPVAGAFLLMTPREGDTPDESTTVRALRDGDRLVFGIWCQARRKPHAGLTARDNVLDGDHISLHLDTDGDGQRAYIFGVNPYGVQVDGILAGDPDFKWDGVWDSATKRGDGEWTAEIEVPFRILRISAQGRPWRIWVRREITSWNEVATWPPYKVGETGPIMVSLKKASDGSYELRFADRGRGLPSGFNLGETKSLGLKVIMGTARQLGGSVEISRLEKGTEFLIRLPADIGIDTAS